MLTVPSLLLYKLYNPTAQMTHRFSVQPIASYLQVTSHRATSPPARQKKKYFGREKNSMTSFSIHATDRLRSRK